MRIGIVLHPFGNSTKGLEQYIIETTRAIIDESKNKNSYTVFVKGNPDTSMIPSEATIIKLPDVCYWHLYLLWWYRACDTFVFFTEVAPLFLWKKSIVVFFDAAYYYFGSRNPFARIRKTFLILWRKWMFRNLQHIVAISEASKRDLVEKFKVPIAQITVIYPGFKTPLVHTLEENIGIHKKPFFMYVGPIKERKNVLRIVEAYIEFRRTTHFNHELYLVGRQSNGTYESKVRACIESGEYKNSIVSMTHIDDVGLYTLYRNATALVYPSLLEGFGLPILEALSVGCVVISSNTTSTSEVLGNSGFLVNPNSTTEIAHAMVRVAEGDYDKERSIHEGILQCRSFSWEKSAKEWESVFLKM